MNRLTLLVSCLVLCVMGSAAMAKEDAPDVKRKKLMAAKWGFLNTVGLDKEQKEKITAIRKEMAADAAKARKEHAGKKEQIASELIKIEEAAFTSAVGVLKPDQKEKLNAQIKKFEDKQSGKPAEKPEKKPDGGDKPKKGDKPDKPAKPEKGDKPGKPEGGDKPKKG